MGRKCSVFNCRTGFVTKGETENPGVSLYRFPTDKAQCQSWIDVLPNKNITVENVTRNMAVCALHWPPDVAYTNIPAN